MQNRKRSKLTVKIVIGQTLNNYAKIGYGNLRVKILITLLQLRFNSNFRLLVTFRFYDNRFIVVNNSNT